jgi:hypothetical protein
MTRFTTGHTKIGGRKKGVPNRVRLEKPHKLIFGDDFRAAMMAEIRATPLEVMHAVMLLRASKGDYDGALVAAEKMAPYVHARLNAAEVKVSHSLAGRSDVDLATDIELLRQKIAIVKRQPPGAPLIELQPEPAATPAEAPAEPAPDHAEF